jgi:hypothetical protein
MNIAIKTKKYITDFCNVMISIYLIIIVLLKLQNFFEWIMKQNQAKISFLMIPIFCIFFKIN